MYAAVSALLHEWFAVVAVAAMICDAQTCRAAENVKIAAVVVASKVHCRTGKFIADNDLRCWLQ